MAVVHAWTTGELRGFRRRLRSWYARNRRDLPWRGTRDAYRVWVSEIMLQQTQVSTVIPYYSRFLQRFPTVRRLAAANENDVLREWEGLGYYRRARQMHSAARMIVAEHGGNVPLDLAALRRLPGIGRYTAGAILSFAHDQRAAILEANTQRLHARLIALREPLHSSASQRLLWRVADVLLP
ncbi:MAG TPA: A/G-specific adenine glycosylase, partial [Pirellulaceae bacterium]